MSDAGPWVPDRPCPHAARIQKGKCEEGRKAPHCQIWQTPKLASLVEYGSTGLGSLLLTCCGS